MNTHPDITEAIQNAIQSIRGMDERERRLTGCDTLAGIREWISTDLEEVRAALEPVQYVTPDYDAHRAAYAFCARLVPDYARPSYKQIDYLARLSTDAGEQTTWSGPLSAKGASYLIDQYLKG